MSFIKIILEKNMVGSPIYRLFPKFLRTRVWQSVAEQVRKDNAIQDEEIENSLPHMELSTKHIVNLQVILNRDNLLSMLPKLSIVAEIGVAGGDFSEKILSITNPKELHLIDAWSNERYSNLREIVVKRFDKNIQQKQVFLHQGYSTLELKKFNEQFFDWVYIDTSHDFETTIAELEICRLKVKKGGIISGHDYVTGNWLGRVRYGVIEAVHEFCIKYNWEMIYITHEVNRHLSFALREIPDDLLHFAVPNEERK